MQILDGRGNWFLNSQQALLYYEHCSLNSLRQYIKVTRVYSTDQKPCLLRSLLKKWSGPFSMNLRLSETHRKKGRSRPVLQAICAVQRNTLIYRFQGYTFQDQTKTQNEKMLIFTVKCFLCIFIVSDIFILKKPRFYLDLWL